MTAITHKQARHYINTLADAFIEEKERENLIAHLDTCEECRAYAAQMKNIESELKDGFHLRWDAHNGPSEKLAQNVQSRARRMVVNNRINLGLRVVAGLGVIIVLVIAINLVIGQLKSHSTKKTIPGVIPTAVSTTSALPTTTALSSSGRLIAFVSEQTGNSDIYVVQTDGNGVSDLTNNPAYDGNPVWSPDGTRIAFESDRNGKRDIFVMNPDGSGLTQLTHDSGNDILRASPDLPSYGVKASEAWSPDGTHILFSNDHTGQWVLSVMNSDGSGVTQLTQANDPPAQSALWSPSGKQVAYTSQTGNGWMQIVAVNIDGTNRRVIATGDPAKSNATWNSARMIAWSQDEQYFYYEYDTSDGNWYILKTAPDGLQAAQEVTSGYALAGGLFGDAWLGKDAVLYYVTVPAGPSNTYRWHRMDNGKALSWDPFTFCNISRADNTTYYSPSWAGSNAGSQLILVVSCTEKGYAELYSPDSTAGAFSEIAQIPTNWNESSLSWSADDQMVLIQGINQSGKTEFYVLKAGDLQTKPSVMPKLIWSGESSKAILQPVPYKNVAAKNQLPVVPSLTANAPNAALWSGTSKGDLIAFASDRTGNDDIYVARSDGSGATDLTSSLESNDAPVWSPDGKTIAFTHYKNNSVPVIYVIHPDGTNLHQVSEDGISLYAWSPDSQKIAYLVSQPQDPTSVGGPAKMSLKVVDLAGNSLQTMDLGIYSLVDQLRWSPDGRSLEYVATQMATDATGETRATESDIDQISLGSQLPEVLVKSAQQIDTWTGSGQIITYLVRDTFTWILMRANRQNQTRLATWAPDSKQCGITNAAINGVVSTNWDYTASSSILRWSPDGKRLLIEANCQEAPWFYLGSSDGKIVELMNHAVFSSGIGPDTFSWSPDGHSIIFTSDMDSSGNLDLYELNVEAALKDPSTHPIRITTSGFHESSPDWQP